MSANISSLLYLVSGVLFVLALRGLSSPTTARQGNYFGMAGMLVAVVTTLTVMDTQSLDTWGIIIAGIAIGGIIGAVIARRIAMTDMPQLVAAFHSLVGMAAVLVAWAAFLSPDAFNIAENGVIKAASLVEMSLGVAIGAITFSGSVIAFAKLQGTMSGAPIMLPQRQMVALQCSIVTALKLNLRRPRLLIPTPKLRKITTRCFRQTVDKVIAGHCLSIKALKIQLGPCKKSIRSQ